MRKRSEGVVYSSRQARASLAHRKLNSSSTLDHINVPIARIAAPYIAKIVTRAMLEL
jgi:hypothetical protein